MAKSTRSAKSGRQQASPALDELVQGLKQRTVKVGVVGLGYVGLPLVVEFAKAGFSALGFDVDASKVERINNGDSYIPDVPSDQLQEVIASGRLEATVDFSRLTEVATVNICVPTPLRKTKDPDLTFVAAATEAIAKHLQEGQLVILESTTYPGTVSYTHLTLPTILLV